MPFPITLQEAERRSASMIAERESWIPEWEDIRNYMLPYHGRFSDDRPNDGQRKDQRIIQDVAKASLRVLSAGLLSGLTSPSRPWFKLNIPNPLLSESKPARSWLDEVERRMYSVFAASNLYSELQKMYVELGGFGTACAIVSKDYEDVIRLRTFTIGEYALALNDSLKVDTMYRDFQMTARQIEQRFGRDNCSDAVKSSIENGRSETWFTVRHLICPNPDIKPGRRDVSGKKFISVYWERGARTDVNDGFLEVLGYDNFPVLAPRWEVVSNDIYGRGPGWDCRGDVKMVQDMRADSMEALDKMIDPPILLPASMRNEDIDLTPGGVTFVPSNEGMTGAHPAFNVAVDMTKLEYSIESAVSRIRTAFYVDTFLMLQQVADKTKTAYEVAELTREKMLMLGPAIEQQEETLLKPIIERTFEIMNDAGLIPDPPEEMQGQSIDIEYVSILAQAQKAVATSGMREWISIVTELSAAFPEMRLKVNPTEFVDEYGKLLGISAKLINSDEEVAEAQAKERQMMQTQQAMAMAQQGAQTAKTMSQARIDDKTNVLAELFGEAGV